MKTLILAQILLLSTAAFASGNCPLNKDRHASLRIPVQKRAAAALNADKSIQRPSSQTKIVQ